MKNKLGEMHSPGILSGHWIKQSPLFHLICISTGFIIYLRKLGLYLRKGD